jgi:polar amino acid transport system ATP-binding protein
MILKDTDIDAKAGEVTVLMGPSGAGKSTFLRCVNHLETIDSGDLLVDGERVGYIERDGKLYERKTRDVSRRRSQIGMVFQGFNLFPHMTVLDNVIAGPMRVLGRKREEASETAYRLLGEVGLREKAAAYPGSLSGGQQQRVAIARALAMEPKLMLFDEPTSALDPQLVGEVLASMRDLAQSGMTMLVVTHEVAFAREVADNVVVMFDGKVLESGPPGRVLVDPAEPETRAFLKRVLH